MLSLVALAAAAAYSQSVHIGIKGGVPLTEIMTVTQPPPYGPGATAISKTNRYVVGATVEVRLPARLSVELDALFRHFSYETSYWISRGSFQETIKANAVEFPLLLKYRLPGAFIAPYLEAGIAWDRLYRVHASGKQQDWSLQWSSYPMDTPSELTNNAVTGLVAGAGVEIRALPRLRLSPELRYTRWRSQHFTDALINSNPNQAEFLLGMTF